MVASSKDTNASVIVVIPTLNEEAHIASVLSQLCDNGEGRYRYEILVADGGSTDNTASIVSDIASTNPAVQLINNPGRTQAAALNLLLGQEFEDVDIIVRADAHAAYPSNFVDDLVSCILDKSTASVVVAMDAIAQDHCFQKGNAWIVDSVLGAGGSPHRGRHASGYVDHGHHAAFTMESFRNTGGYDTTFLANEDAEYDHRLAQSGGKVWLEAGIRIAYYPRSSLSGLWRQYLKYGMGRAQTCLKHGIRPKLRQMIPAIHVAILALSLLVLPFTMLGLIWPLFYLAVVSAAGILSATKHRSTCGLWGSPALAVMHSAWGLGFLRVVLARVVFFGRGVNEPSVTEGGVG